MSGPIPLSAKDFSAVLEAAGEDAVPDLGPTHDPGLAPDTSLPNPEAVPDSAAVLAPNAIPDPFDDADALSELEHEVITLAAHIEAATYRLLVLIR